MLERIKQQWANSPLWQRLLIVIIAPAVVIGALWFYTIKPNIEKKKELEGQIAQLKQEIEKYNRLIQPGVLKKLEQQLEELKKQEEMTRTELEKVVGKIPTREEIERILGEINFMAGIRNLVITRIAVAQPKVTNLQLVEAGDRKLVKVVAQQKQPPNRRMARRNRQAKGPQPNQQQKPQQAGIPVTTMEVQMTVEGRTSDLYSFLESLYRKGLVSYPKSVRISPVKGANMISADVIIDIILQR